MELSDLKGALLQELCQGIPEGTRVIGREIGHGVVMRIASNPDQVRLIMASGLVRDLLSCLEGGEGHNLQRSDIHRIQQNAEQHFQTAREVTRSSGGLKRLEEHSQAVRTVLTRVLGSLPE